MTCRICHEHVKVPVKFTCFPCRTQHGRPACNSLIRVCLLCARLYLQLNLPKNRRNPTKRCLTCPATIRPSTLTAVSAYEKDFMLMNADNRTDIPCAHEGDGCLMKGTQNELDHHLSNDCVYRTISCKYCKTYFRAHQDHLKDCPACITCRLCSSRIEKNDYGQHMIRIHDSFCCGDCGTIIPKEQTDVHKKQDCPFRKQTCLFCDTHVYAKFYKKHIVEHITVSLKAISEATEKIKVHTSDLEKLNAMLENI